MDLNAEVKIEDVQFMKIKGRNPESKEKLAMHYKGSLLVRWLSLWSMGYGFKEESSHVQISIPMVCCIAQFYNSNVNANSILSVYIECDEYELAV